MSTQHEAVAIEDLLAHSNWVRSLARSLVSDPGTAEDLVQETWLAALRRPPRRAADARSWLGRVVRNAAAQRHRAEGARSAREREPREREVPSPAEVADRLETQRGLAEELVALEEPLRRTLYLRYYEGLAPAEIADLTDTPAGTVRWRLKRGLDELRERLDRRAGGERRVWVEALLPLGRAVDRSGTAGGGAVAAGSAGTGAAAVLAKVALAAAVVALGAVGWRSLQRAERAPRAASAVPVEVAAVSPAEPGAAVAAPTAALVGRRSVEPGQQGSPDAGQDAAAPRALAAGEARFELAVVGPDGRAVPGAEIRPSGRIAGLFAEEPLAVTGADGRAEVLWNARASGGRVSIAVVAEGFELLRHSFELSAGEELDAGTVALAAGAVAVGRVQDESGAAVADAWLDWERAEAPAGEPFFPFTSNVSAAAVRQRSNRPHGQLRTDASGRFRLPGLPVGAVRLWAVAEGRVATPIELAALEPGEVRAEVALTLPRWPRAETIAGRVLDPEGAPLSRGTVELRAPDGMTTVSVGRDGSFAALVDPTAEHLLRARALRSHGWTEPVLEGVRGGETQVELRFGPADRTLLVVTGPDGRPVERFQVTVRPRDPDSTTRTLSGRGPEPLELALPHEACMVEIRADGHGARELGPFEPGLVPERLECAFEGRAGSIRGRVVDPAGRPVAGAHVRLRRRASGRAHVWGFPVLVESLLLGDALTQDDGRFELVPLPTDPLGHPITRPGGKTVTHTLGDVPAELTAAPVYVLFAETRGRALAQSEPFRSETVQEAGVELPDLVLGEVGAIAGRVLVPDGTVLAGRVVAASRGDSFVKTLELEADGRFRFKELTPGPWFVQLLPAGGYGHSNAPRTGGPWSELPSNVVVVAGETATLDLDRTHGATVRASVSVDGAAPERFSVRLLPDWLEPDDFHPWYPPVVAEAETTCTAPAEVPGTWWQEVLVTLGRATLRVRSRPELHAGEQEWALNFATGTLEIEGAPLRGTVSLAWIDGAAEGLFIVMPNGTASHTVRAPAGRLRAIRPKDPAAPGDWRTWPVLAELELAPGGSASLDLR